MDNALILSLFCSKFSVDNGSFRTVWASPPAAEIEFQLPSILAVLVGYIGEDFLFLESYARNAVAPRPDALAAIDGLLQKRKPRLKELASLGLQELHHFGN